MNRFEYDGTIFDLDRTYIDVIGVEWRWTGQWNTAGEPLLRGNARTPVPLPDVYHDRGPLIPLASAASHELKRAVLAADSPLAADLAAGHAESLAEYDARLNAKAGAR